MDIRDATPADAAGIADIFNDAVRTTTAVWMETEVDVAERAAWIAERQAVGYPVLVAVRGDQILGFSTFGEFRARDGYRGTVENSVYVHRDARGQGVAQALLAALLPPARALGKHAMMAGIAADNDVSIRLHARMGFVETGRLPQVGQKFGRWLDLVFMQLLLDDRPAP